MASTFLRITIHLIFATHGRRSTIADTWREELHGYLSGTLHGLGATPIRIGGTADHVHLLVSIKATHSVADLVRELKKASAVWARERCPDFRWQEGYAAFSIGRSEVEHVSAYVANQEQHHRTVSASEELRAILAEFGIPIDERFFE